MITLRLLTVLAASSLAGIAYAQTQPKPSTQPSAPPGYNAHNPHQTEMKSVGKEEASPKNRSAPGSGLTTPETGSQASPSSKTAPGMTLATPQHSHRMNESVRMAELGPAGHPWSEMSVESPSGKSLGSVSKVVPGLNGRKESGYVLVTGAHGMMVPVPYQVASAKARDGKLVLSQDQFQGAPKVTEEDLQNRSDHAWRSKADHYWMGKGKGQDQMQ